MGVKESRNPLYNPHLADDISSRLRVGWKKVKKGKTAKLDIAGLGKVSVSGSDVSSMSDGAVSTAAMALVTRAYDKADKIIDRVTEGVAELMKQLDETNVAFIDADVDLEMADARLKSDNVSKEKKAKIEEERPELVKKKRKLKYLKDSQRKQLDNQLKILATAELERKGILEDCKASMNRMSISESEAGRATKVFEGAQELADVTRKQS